MKRKVKAWLILVFGKPTMVSCDLEDLQRYTKFHEDIIPCTITYELPETPKRKARR